MSSPSFELQRCQCMFYQMRVLSGGQITACPLSPNACWWPFSSTMSHPPLLPLSGRNSSGLFTQCCALCAICCTVLLYFQGTVLPDEEYLFFVFMYYLCEQYYKPITAQYYIADGVSYIWLKPLWKKMSQSTQAETQDSWWYNLVWVQGPESRECWCLMARRDDVLPQAKGQIHSPFIFLSFQPQRIGGNSPALVRMNFTCSPRPNAMLFGKHPYRHT